jgi:hypothetical protein
MKQVDFTVRGFGPEARAAAKEFIRMAADISKCRPIVRSQPSSLEKVFGLGLQVAKTLEGKIKVFGFDMVDSSKGKLAIKIIQQRKDEISALLDAASVFGVSYPGYCLTCPAYVLEWKRTHNKKVHTEWCCHAAFFNGKGESPIRLERYDCEFPAFKRYRKKKKIGCPRISPEHQSVRW